MTTIKQLLQLARARNNAPSTYLSNPKSNSGNVNAKAVTEAEAEASRSSNQDEGMDDNQPNLDVYMNSSIIPFSPFQFQLETVRVGQIHTCYYVSDWINAAEEQALLDVLGKAPSSSWVQLRGRSLQCWGGTSATDSTINAPLPSYLMSLLECVKNTQIFEDASLPDPRHVLINRYESGQGIMAHRDGPAYHSLVCILSIGSSCVMNFYPQPPSSAYLSEERAAIEGGITQQSTQTSQSAVASLLLLPRSLLIFTEDLYTKYFHMIDEINSDFVHKGLTNGDSVQHLQGQHLHRELRYSFTIRSAKFHNSSP